MSIAKLKKQIEQLPAIPGVYYFYNSSGEVLYIGKATNLKSRVKSYFQKSGTRLIEQMIFEVAEIKTKSTGSALEAFFLESAEIRRLQPKYNILSKDDKSKFIVFITNEAVPRIILAREKDLIGNSNPKRQISKLQLKIKNKESDGASSSVFFVTPKVMAPSSEQAPRYSPSCNKLLKGIYFGPFASSGELKIALKLLRKIFPFCDQPFGGKPCFYSYIGLCPGICTGKISLSEYKKNFRRIKFFLQGRVGELKKKIAIEMRRLAKAQKFEEAEICKKQLFALSHIQDIALTFSCDRIKINNNNFVVEAFDISNLGEQFTVGSRVIFINGQRAFEHYRKFKIKNLYPNLTARWVDNNIGDLAMMREMLERRKKHIEWIKPNLIVIDGGKAHLNLAQKIFGKEIPIVAIAKGPRRKKNEFFGDKISKEIQRVAIHSRDEAHRFAIKYHRQLKNKGCFGAGSLL